MNKKKIIIVLLIILVFLTISMVILGISSNNVVVFVTDINNINIVRVKYNSKVKEVIIKDDDFIGWYYNDEKFDFKTKIKNDLVLVAKYDQRKEYTITFDTDSKDEISPVTVKEGDKLKKPTNPSKDGYSFVRWELNNEEFDFDTIITEDINLKAVWLEISDYVMVHFDSNGGTKVESQKVKLNNKATLPKEPTRSGYEFITWQLDGKNYDFNNSITKEITLIATWKEKKKVTLSFDTKGGSSVSSKQVYENEKVGTLPTPTKTGYVFSKWELNGKTFNQNSTINKNTKVTAVWISEDENNLTQAKNAIKSKYEITKSNQVIEIKSSGCTISHNSIGQITRKTKDTTMSLVFQISCGSLKEEVKSSGIIKASTYKYTATPSGNMLNSIVKVGSVNSGSLFSNGINIGNINNGEAIVNDVDLEGNPTLQMKITGDNTIYEVSKG